jgi:hypothetical protein
VAVVLGLQMLAGRRRVLEERPPLPLVAAKAVSACGFVGCRQRARFEVSVPSYQQRACASHIEWAMNLMGTWPVTVFPIAKYEPPPPLPAWVVDAAPSMDSSLES